jgi:hypothetical protein
MKRLYSTRSSSTCETLSLFAVSLSLSLPPASCLLLHTMPIIRYHDTYTHTHTHTHILKVCVRERERQTDRETESE